MTREKALQVDALLVKIEAYEALRDTIINDEQVAELTWEYSDVELGNELLAVVQTRLDVLLKELEEM